MKNAVKHKRGQRVAPELWLQVEQEYCRPPFPSIRDLAEKHGISEGGIVRRSVRDGWPAKKQAILDKSRITEAEAVKDLAKRQEKVVADIERVGSSLLSHIERKLKSYDLYQADVLKEQSYKDLALAFKATAETLRENMGLSAAPLEPPKDLIVHITTKPEV